MDTYTDSLTKRYDTAIAERDYREAEACASELAARYIAPPAWGERDYSKGETWLILAKAARGIGRTVERRAPLNREQRAFAGQHVDTDGSNRYGVFTLDAEGIPSVWHYVGSLSEARTIAERHNAREEGRAL